ncbi:single-stranded DNA-binding protein 3 isoform X13 [Macaca mulatta]
MFAKGKGSAVPSDGQAREKLALYVYEYLLHVGAQKSAQTFLSEIRWEKNITLGEPPGFLHSWWCVFWDLYCAAPERRDTCEHSSEAKAFHDYSAAAAPSPVLGNIPPNDGMPGGPIPPGFFQGPPGSQPSPHAQPPPHNPSSMMGPHSQPFMSPRYAGGPRPPIRMGNQPPGGVPGTQPLLPNSMDPTRQQGHPNMGGSMQRMNPPRGMGPMGPGPQSLLVGSKTKSIPSYLPEPMGKVQDDVVGAQRRQQLAGYPHVFENFILKAPENALNVVTVPLCWLVIVVPVTWFPPTPLFLKECIIFSHRSFHRLTLSLCFVCLFLLPPPLSGSLLLLID